MATILLKMKRVLRAFKRLGHQPVFDWYFCLMATSVLILAVVIVCLVGYVRLGYSDVPIPAMESSSEGQVNFSVSSIQKTLDALEQKRKSARSIPSSILVDPAL
jgi:hypothetical protein